MGIQLNVTEWMRGHVTLGATDYAAGETEGKKTNTTFDHEVLIQMLDIDRFTKEPTHTAPMDGHVVWLGNKWPFKGGTFSMLVDSTDKRIKHMFYRIPFEADGKPMTMLGHKELRDHAGLDVPKDITTLFIRIYDRAVEGHDFSKPSPAIPVWPEDPYAMGIIHIPIRDGINSAMSFAAPGSSDAAKHKAVIQFLRFYGDGIVALYMPRAGSSRNVAIVVGIALLAGLVGLGIWLLRG